MFPTHRAVTALAALVIAGLLAICSAKTVVAESPSGPACWSPRELAIEPRARFISRGADAFRHMPKRANPISQPPRAHFGAIRRVELPPESKKLIALTFDLCEQPYEVTGYDGAIIDLLRQLSVRATFFAGGKWLLTHKTPAQQLMADPLFELGNHTWEHRNLRLLKGETLANEIEGAQIAYEEVRRQLAARQCIAPDGSLAHARAPEHLEIFRFPYGACDPTSLEAVASRGLLAIQWDVSSGDSILGLAADRIASAVLSSVRPGSIVLFHANGRGWQTARALPRIIAELRKRDFEFVTVSELLAAPGAKWDIRPICFDNRPGDTNRYDAFAAGLHAAYKRFADRAAPAPGVATPSEATSAPNVIVPPKPEPAKRPSRIHMFSPRLDPSPPY